MPGTVAPPCVTKNVLVVIEVGLSSSLKVAVRPLFVATPVAESEGIVEKTVGIELTVLEVPPPPLHDIKSRSGVAIDASLLKSRRES